ncbi:Kinase superfamily protein putative isoform 1 [Tripterygium wilfordii]|uniref:non-specific serine/threonine protein kinase n=1 Tax=Tripterygium wilfordii TaxID=458696 RepID=A0A7J7E123_TRIWF|nr:receptor-like cytosolic serine/threonine-protein kinase RBK2 [Tripterygium wilfordii]KAF5752243.1 Kinase superfamily protein putative isoform 1 [Tripterygium wilfordii]
MGDVREPSAAPCNGSRDIAEENQESKLTSVAGRRSQACLSDPLEFHDLQLLGAEDDSIDESSPRGVLDKFSTSMESAKTRKESEKPPKTSTSDSEGQINPGAPIHWRGFFRSLKEGPAAHLWTMPPLKSVPKLTRKKNKRIRDSVTSAFTTFFDADLCYFKSSWKNFTLSELEAATNNFSHENLIGEGGYAEVYKGELPDGQLVAIKRLTRGSPEEMTTDFLSELGIIVHIDHPNLAKLIGYGVEGGMHLVLQLSPHGSLASLLYGSKEKLDWGIRFKVALGTAEGLHYLHEGCQRRIIHKDIKASNILLTEDFEPQISDFGLAKWLPDQWTHHTVDKVEGTFGYLPPEFFMHGIVDEKTDVYAFGVLLLELITGRMALDSSQQSLVMWAKPLIMKNSIKELVDPTIAGAYDSEEMNRVVLTASMCIHQDPEERPQMSQVLQILKGDESILQQIKLRQNSRLQSSYSEEPCDPDETNPATYLNDLHRHMEVVLGHHDEG